LSLLEIFAVINIINVAIFTLEKKGTRDEKRVVLRGKSSTKKKKKKKKVG